MRIKRGIRTWPRVLVWGILLVVTACAAPPATPQSVSTSPTHAAVTLQPATQQPATLTVTHTVVPPPTATATRTPKPTFTPKPSPTLPDLDILACLPPDGERVTGVVAGVIDGDTIVVQSGFLSWTIRYLGVDTPETNVQPAERMGLEAKARNRDLVTGKRVILIADPEAGDTDIYDRLLRYVVAGDTFVNYQLVREGLARYYASDFSCGPLIFQAEMDARADDLGLWGP
jgi:micrococcal nuclease